MRQIVKILSFSTFLWATVGHAEYYALSCAVTPMSEKGQEASQKFGHANMFLGGVCLDRGATIPQLSLDCANATEDGVGLSSNAYFKNVRWIGSPGFEFYMNGGIAPDFKLTKDFYTQTIKDLRTKNILRGIEAQPVEWISSKMGTVEFEQDEIAGSIGTDFALTWSRYAYCSRIPLSRSQLERIVPYVNQLNREYTDTGKTFELSFLNNNCSHLVNNVLWQAGYLNEKEFEDPVPYLDNNLAVPMNIIIDTYSGIVLPEFPDVEDIYRNARWANLLMRDNQIVGRDGMIGEIHPVHGANDSSLNEVFDTRNVTATFLDLPLLESNRRAAAAVFDTKALMNLDSNRLKFIQLYSQKLDELKPVGSYAVNHLTMGDRRNPVVRFKPDHNYSFEQIYKAYKQFLTDRLAVLQKQQ